MAAQRARRAGDQLSAPQAGPRFDAAHQFTRETVGIGGADHAFDELAGAPVVGPAGRRVHPHQRQVAELQVDGLGDPALVGVARRDDQAARPDQARQRDRRVALLDPVDCRLRVAGDREGAAGRQARHLLAEAGRRVLEAVHAREPRDVVQLFLEAAQRRREQTGGRQPRREAGGDRGERGRRQRRQRRDVDRDAGGVDDRARHLEPPQPFGREPLRHDRDHAAARLDPRLQRVEQQPGRRRLRDGVDASLGADEPLGFESETHDHRNLAWRHVLRGSGALRWARRSGHGRKVRGLLFLPSGHRATIEAEEGIQSNPDASRAGSM